MEYLIKPNGEGLFAEKKNGIAMIDSRTVAEVFEKRHDAVLRDIKNLDCSADFNLHNFVEIKYKDSKGKKRPCYNMTRDGFSLLIMGESRKGWNAATKTILKGDE